MPTPFAPATGGLVSPSDPHEVPVTPTPIDCHDGFALVAPSDDAIEVLSFAGGLDQWAATYTSTDASGVARTFFVAMDTTGAASAPPREVPLGTRAASFGYDMLLVGPSVGETFLATAGWDRVEVRDAAVWPEGIDPTARVVSVHAEPNRCLKETVLVVQAESGRSVLAVHRGGALELEVTRLFDLPLVPDGTTSLLAYSHSEIIEILGSESEDVSPRVAVYRTDGTTWTLAREITAWDGGPSHALAASRSWEGWNVLGVSPTGRTVTLLADDGTTSTPIAVGSESASDRAVMTTSSDTTLFTTGGTLGALHYGAITLEEALPLASPTLAWRVISDMAVLGASEDGLALRCYTQDRLRAPAP